MALMERFRVSTVLLPLLCFIYLYMLGNSTTFGYESRKDPGYLMSCIVTVIMFHSLEASLQRHREKGFRYARKFCR